MHTVRAMIVIKKSKYKMMNEVSDGKMQEKLASILDAINTNGVPWIDEIIMSEIMHRIKKICNERRINVLRVVGVGLLMLL